MKARIKIKIEYPKKGKAMLFFYPQTKKNFFSRWKGKEGFVDIDKACGFLLQTLRLTEKSLFQVRQFKPVSSKNYIYG